MIDVDNRAKELWGKVSKSFGRNAQAASARPTPGHKPHLPLNTSERTIHRVSSRMSVQTVLQSSSPGDILELASGVYTDPFVVDIPDIIIRCAPGADVVIEPSSGKSHRAAVLFKVPDWCLLEGIKISHSGVAIEIDKSSPEIRNCDISGARGCILISPNAQYPAMYPVITNCKIHNAVNGYGVSILGGKAVIEKCDIYRNQDAGIVVGTKSTPWIGENKIHDGFGCGIAVTEGSAGVVIQNIITSNGCSGVVVEGGSDPIVVRNTIESGLAYGISVSKGSRGCFENNTVRDNAEYDVIVQGSQTDPIFRSNTFLGNVSPAFLFSENAQGTVTRNYFDNYKCNIITVGPCARPTIVDNEFKVIEPHNAVCVMDGGGGVIQGNAVVVTPLQKNGAAPHWVPFTIKSAFAKPTISGNEVVRALEDVSNQNSSPESSKSGAGFTPPKVIVFSQSPPPEQGVHLEDSMSPPRAVESLSNRIPFTARGSKDLVRRRQSEPLIHSARRPSQQHVLPSWGVSPTSPAAVPPPPPDTTPRKSMSFSRRTSSFSASKNGTSSNNSTTTPKVRDVENIPVEELSIVELKQELEKFRAQLTVAELRRELEDFRRRKSMMRVPYSNV